MGKTINNFYGAGFSLAGEAGEVIKIDQGGGAYAVGFRDIIISQRTRLFEYENWPFTQQTPEELEEMLYEYGKVAVIDLKIGTKENKELIFVPVSITGRKRITKINYESLHVNIAGEWNSEITTAYDLNDKQYKKDLPFIFDNPRQYIPFVLQEVLFSELASTRNGLKSNRINKNKQSIVEVEDGQQLEKAIQLNATTDDMSPFIIVTKNSKKNKDQPLQGSDIKQLTNSTPDMYNSFSTEITDLKKEISIVNGIRSSQLGNKSSAQETDTQTNTMDRDIANVLLFMIKSRKESLKRIRSIFGINLKIRLNDSIQQFINAVINKEAEEAAKEKNNED